MYGGGALTSIDPKKICKFSTLLSISLLEYD